ncbi:uncharacterized protein LOC122668653 [Telopea speciosissima]|uniref:uncharacterized protein LOC122668653 n=1 Tax=Telopea speciosissima TaxID=54955 RepID=UPI001CC4EED8|nr:uncharacterized protein LOC122668653 [Telopea speciosissima]
MAEVWRRSPVRFNDQAIRFQRWKPDFNIHEQQVLTKLVWVRFPDLSLEYWHENVLLSMAKAVGRPVALDRRTRQGLLCHFARVLVEIDAGDSSTRVEEVQVERFEPGSTKEFCFTQKVIYEDGLQRCGYCRRLGHQSSLCRQKRMDELHQQEKDREASIPGAIYVGEDGVNSVNSKSNSMGGSARKSLSQGKNSFSPNSKAPAGHEGIVVSNLVAAFEGREKSYNGMTLGENSISPQSPNLTQSGKDKDTFLNVGETPVVESIRPPSTHPSHGGGLENLPAFGVPDFAVGGGLERRDVEVGESNFNEVELVQRLDSHGSGCDQSDQEEVQGGWTQVLDRKNRDGRRNAPRGGRVGCRMATPVIGRTRRQKKAKSGVKAVDTAVEKPLVEKETASPFSPEEEALLAHVAFDRPGVYAEIPRRSNRTRTPSVRLPDPP